MDCDTQLASTYRFTPTLLSAGDCDRRKVGQSDLVFGVRSRFISRSVHARLQVFACIDYNLCHLG